MQELVVGLLTGAAGGGLLGYWMRAKIDDHFAAQRMHREFRLSDTRDMRERLRSFLGQPQTHFWQLEGLTSSDEPTVVSDREAKARSVSTWVTENASYFPAEVQRRMFLIGAVAQQLGRGDRHFLESATGPESIMEAWSALEDLTRSLTDDLHG